MLQVTRSGFRALRRAASKPICAITPGRKFSTSTSLVAISRAKTALPSSLRRFSDSERLLRLNAAKYQERPSFMTPCWRRRIADPLCLDLDHLGAHIGQHQGAERPGQDASQIDDPDPR